MNKLTQEDIASHLGKRQGTISKYLRCELKISLTEAHKVEDIGLPMTIFISASQQKEHLGKAFLDIDSPHNIDKKPKEEA